MPTSAPRPVVVTRQFRGPSKSGNGGYTAGLLTSSLGAARRPVTVTLRRPPPLDTEMLVRVPSDGGGVEMWHDDLLVASAVPGTFAGGVVEAVDLGSATAARSAYQGATNHPFPGCFVCGPGREAGDGMRLAPGMVGPGRTACVWVPEPSHAAGDDRSFVGTEFAWAALDCPGGWTSDIQQRPMVLGRMTASVSAAPRVGRPHVVVGRLVGEEGRKTFTATALYDEDGRLAGRAEHTWIHIDPATFSPSG